VSQEVAHDTLSKYLKSKGGLRATAERHAILDAVLQTQGHFDAEGLYSRLISSGIKVSKATVYNTLNLFQSAGLVSKYRFAESSSRYEKAFGRPHHHHLVCLSCGDIIEFVHDRLEKIQAEVCNENKFLPQSSSLQIFGICSRCKKDEP
jgi:Fur family ferric uptake transcriptional regulator